jgi:hypothetical protein
VIESVRAFAKSSALTDGLASTSGVSCFGSYPVRTAKQDVDQFFLAQSRGLFSSRMAPEPQHDAPAHHLACVWPAFITCEGAGEFRWFTPYQTHP